MNVHKSYLVFFQQYKTEYHNHSYLIQLPCKVGGTGMTKAFPLMIWLLKMCCYIQSPTLQSFYLHPSAKFYTAFLFDCLNGHLPRGRKVGLGSLPHVEAGIYSTAPFQANLSNIKNIPTSIGEVKSFHGSYQESNPVL